jgi:hypothetical protein
MREPAFRQMPSEPIGHRFAEWLAERTTVEAALDRTPEKDSVKREALLDRAIELERLILYTPDQTPSAIRAKAHVLRWLMEMAHAEELPAMREIEEFVGAFVDPDVNGVRSN